MHYILLLNSSYFKQCFIFYVLEWRLNSVGGFKFEMHNK